MSKKTININVIRYARLQNILVDFKKFEKLGIKY